jgi:murein L,D-transpeptidase YcbB/YkuD
LANWLFGHEAPVPGDDSEDNVRIGDAGVPIYISYLTARPDGTSISFANDVYKLDGQGADAKPVTTAASAGR